MKENYENIQMDTSRPDDTDAVHSVALGDDVDYRSMAKVKALVDNAFNEVSKGKINPKVALGVLRSDLRIIFVKY